MVERARGESRRVRISSVYMLGVIGFWFDIYSDFEHFFLPSVFQKDQELSLHSNGLCCFSNTSALRNDFSY